MHKFCTTAAASAIVISTPNTAGATPLVTRDCARPWRLGRAGAGRMCSLWSSDRARNGLGFRSRARRGELPGAESRRVQSGHDSAGVIP
jgi:hypothetical protein